MTDVDQIRRHATELVATAPDVILANGSATVSPLLQVSRTIPIVFVSVGDPSGCTVATLTCHGRQATLFQRKLSGASGLSCPLSCPTGKYGEAKPDGQPRPQRPPK